MDVDEPTEETAETAMDLDTVESDLIDSVNTDSQISQIHNHNIQDKRVRQLVMKRLLQLFKLFESSAFKRLKPFHADLFDKILNPRINQLATHFTNSNSSSALLEIFLVCAAANLPEEDLIEILLNKSPQLWSKSVEAALESTKPLIVKPAAQFL